MKYIIDNGDEFRKKYPALEKMMAEKRYEVAIEYIIKLLSDTEIVDFLKANILGFCGLAYYKIGDTENSLICYLKAEKIYWSSGNFYADRLKQIKNSLGVVYNMRKEYDKALLVLFESIELSQKYNLSDLTGYNNLASVYTRLNDHSKAIYYYNLAINGLFKFKDLPKSSLFLCYINKGRSLILLGKLSHAEFILSRLLEFESIKEYPELEGLSFSTLAQIFFKRGQVGQSALYCRKALGFINSNGTTHFEIHTNILMSDILLTLNDTTESYKYLERALKSSREVFNNRTAEVLRKIVFYHERMNQFSKGQEVLEELISLEMSERVNLEKNEFFEIQKRFEASQKDRLIDSQKLLNSKLEAHNEALELAIDDQRRIELQIKSLQLQLSPHFIFNTLQSIQGFIFQQDAMETSDYLAKFASLMRAVLNASKKDKISVAEEIELLDTYMLLEQKRFESKFNFRIITKGFSNLNKVFLPSLLVQPFIENAIIHGLSAKEGGNLDVFFRKFGQTTFIHVVDNGIGWKASSMMNSRERIGSSTALKIMQERQKFSLESNIFHFVYKILDRKNARGCTGTHVVLRIVELL